MSKTIQSATHLMVRAEVRYWEDAEVNGVSDEDGSRIPFREGDLWCPVIRLEDGSITNWPVGKHASIHYKVCDQGQYWLLNEEQKRVAKYFSDYVPSMLAVKSSGYGDYIILDVDANGLIEEWKRPRLDPDQWMDLEAA